MLTRYALFCLLFVLPSLAFGQPRRALWVWHTSAILENVNGEQQALFDFCAQPPGSTDALALAENKLPITQLYFYAHSYVGGDSTRKAKLRSFLKSAHANGISVDFLDGAPDWATTAKAYGEKYVQYVLDFNASSSSAAERFDGIQLDVEPYLLTGWFSTSLWDSYLSFLKACKAKIDAASSTLRFGAAIPRWYDSNPGRAYLVELQKIPDYVAVMNYVDRASSMISDIANELKIADSLGTEVVAGSETLKTDPTSVTFLEEGWSNMEARLYEMLRAYGSHKALTAIAIHDYTAYNALGKFGTAGVDATAPFAIGGSHAGSALTISLHDVCGTGVSAGSSYTASTASLDGKALSGSWSGAGSSVTFSSSSSLDAGGMVKLVVQPTDAKGNWRKDTITLPITSRPLAVFPSNGSSNVGTSVSLRWNKAVNARSYRLEISPSSAFSTLAFVDSTLTDTSRLVTTLAISSTYYWRVSAAGSNSISRSSSVSTFNTGAADSILLADNSTDTIIVTNPKRGRKKSLIEPRIVSASFDRRSTTRTSTAIGEVYPNPATTTVSIPVNTGISSVGLYSLKGEKLAEQQLGQAQESISLDVSSYPAGTYYIVLESPGGNITKQLIIGGRP